MGPISPGKITNKDDQKFRYLPFIMVSYNDIKHFAKVQKYWPGKIGLQFFMIKLEPFFFADFGFSDIQEISANAADNTMVTVVRVGEEFIATTDLPKVNR